MKSTSEGIDILIVADAEDHLFTGRTENLKNGIVAFETHLGLTVVGCNETTNHKNKVIESLEMFVQDAPGSDLWSLDVLGITDPVLKKAREEADREVKEKFLESIKVNEEGRYRRY